MITLDNITLVCIDGRDDSYNTFKSLKALKYSSLDIQFKEKIFLSPAIKGDENKILLKEWDILHIEIPPINWLEYNTFVLKELKNYINTDYCILQSWDGFIINPNLWTPDFLNYDYIGASWPEWLIQCSKWVDTDVKLSRNYSLVGNGGFCLRSKKLLEIASNAPFPINGPDDAYICQNHYGYFKDKGIKFAPVEIADKFSREANHSLSWDSVFGFHDASVGFIETI